MVTRSIAGGSSHTKFSLWDTTFVRVLSSTRKCFYKVDSDFEEQAKAIFSDLKINVVTGFKFIGGFIGSGNDIEKWLIEKVQKWVSCVHSLALAAEEFPHSAHAVLNMNGDILCV